MKLLIRIFNIVIMAISAAACVFLFMPPALSFNSKVTVNVATFSQFVPETPYSSGIDIPELLGTDSIYVGIKFQLDTQGVMGIMHGDKDKINDSLISKNVDEIVGILHEPVDLMTDFFIRENIKKLVHEQIYNYVDEARQKYDTNGAVASSTEDIMDEVGMDDEYFTNFANALYDAANADDATVDSASAVFFDQINEALAKAEESGAVDTSGFTEENKAGVKDSLVGVLESLNLVEDDGHLKKISHIAYLYLSDYLVGELNSSVPESELAQKTEESIPDYADRLLGLYVTEKMPDMVYTIIGYVGLGLFIALIVFAAVWAILFLITLIKTFTKKPWTIFGFWFWPIGIIELVLGFGLTAIAKFALTKVDIAALGLPISGLLVAIRTYALIPSILFAVMFVFAIVYAIFRSIAKKSVI